MGSTRARSGFTLVELVIVLAVISLVAGLAVPRYASAAARYRVQTAAKRITADLAQARSRARALSAPVTVLFSGAARYEVFVVNGARPGTITDLAVEPYRIVIDSVDFQGVAEVTFNAYGDCPKGTMTIKGGPWGAALDVDTSGRVTVSGV